MSSAFTYLEICALKPQHGPASPAGPSIVMSTSPCFPTSCKKKEKKDPLTN